MLTMEDGPALRLRDLHFSYHGRIVLEGTSFSIDHGEIVSLLGANGAGKSTLLRLAIGLLKPSSGEVLLQGHPIKNLTRKAIARSLAYVPQAHVAPFPFEVREVVMLGRLAENGLFRGPSRTDQMIVTQSLEQLGIAHLAQRPYTQVSGGERQLALIARALAQGARLLVLDEPATGLDYGHQIRLLQKLKQLRGEGFGILMTTHHPDHAVSVSTRVIALKHGRIMRDGAPSDVVTSDTIFELYGVQVANPLTIAAYE